MKKTFTRLVALVLAVSLTLPVFTVSSLAVDPGTIAVGEALLQYIIANFGGIEDSIRTAASEFTWNWLGPQDAYGLFYVVNWYNCDGGWRGDLYNTNPVYRAYTDFIDKMCGANTLVPHDLYATIELDSANGNVYRPRLRGTGGDGRPGNGAWLVDKNGNYPYCSQSEWEASPYFSGNSSGVNAPAQDSVWNPYRNKWVPSEEVNFSSGAIATKDALASALLELGRGELWAVQLGRGKYFLLYDKINDEYWCNNNKQCWMAPVNDDNVIINSKLDYIIDKLPDPEPTPTPEPTATPGPSPAPGGDKEVWNGTLIDLSNGKFSLFDDINLNIDKVTYDFSTKNYTVNCYDIDYNYYTYNVQYTYNNTYVTYIGSTAEFQPKEYELYYELPDGRSSADLTEEDIAGVSFQFADVVNYKRAVTDESLLALYHFDGDTEDDSYYSYPLPRYNTSWKALPEGYTQLEYIESTGTQYIKIDTSVVGAASSFDLDFQNLRDNVTKNIFSVKATSNGQWEFELSGFPERAYFLANDSRRLQTVGFNRGRHHFIFNFSAATYSIAGVAGSLIGERPGTGTSGWLSAPSYLFSDSEGKNIATGRFYSLKTTFGGSVNRYFIPCISPSGEVGIYDNSYFLKYGSYPSDPDNYFYGNSGSGEFIAGPAVKSQLQPTGIDYPRFVWTKGASITYMESNAFNGALYLDETEHEFKINLPKTLGRDFSVYFRYYQNSSKDTNHIENYISSYGNKLLSWSEQHMYAPDGHQLTTPLSVGSWQEIALFCKGNDLHIYHNGIKVETVSLTAALSDSLVFHFGPNSRAYSMLDEIRILDFPRTTWKSYTPTVVPMDTNEVLVLPGTKVQVSGLDTYYKYTVLNGGSVYSKFDGMDYEEGNYDTEFWFNNRVCYDEEEGYYAWGYPEGVDKSDILESNSGPGHGPFDDYTFTYDPIVVTAGTANDAHGVSSSSEGVISVSSVTPNVILHSDGDFYLSDPAAAPMFIWGLKMKSGSSNWGYMGCYYDSTVSSYFNVVFDDYSIARVPVTWGGDGGSVKTFTATSSTGKTAHIQFVTKGSNYWSSYDGAYLQYYTVYDSDPFRMFWIGGQSAVDVDVIHDYYNSASDSALAVNTAALQTDIPIRSYLVGGVRPIYPELGDVWMPVEGRRISGVQIYNGRAWEAVEARWWTGSRWIPIYAFDIVTLADMWDVIGSDGKPVTPTITTETGFWNWWKNQWLDFRDWVSGLVNKVAAEWKDFREKLLSALEDIKIKYDFHFTPGKEKYKEVEKTYVVDFTDIPQLESGQVVNYACGTDNYFTANGNRVRRENSGVQFNDYTGYGYYTFGGVTKPGQLEQRSIKFTTNSAGAVVKVWWTWEKGDRYVAVVNSSGAAQSEDFANSWADDDQGKRNVTAWNLSDAGTYYITAVIGDCRVYKVEVVDTILVISDA